MRLGLLAGIAGSLVLAGNAWAQDTEKCVAVAPLPAEFAHWAHNDRLSAAATPDAAQSRVLPVGAARKLTLLPAATVQLLAPPERANTSTSKAGLVAFDIARIGTYRVALSTPAWVEVVSQGKPAKSAGHSHGPECSGIRKIVDFTLTPGRYVLQLNASEASEITAMIALSSKQT